MHRVVFVRHGESEANVLGLISEDYDKFPLTERGKRQVSFVASQLGDYYFDGIISSPVLRTRETAAIIGDKLGMKTMLDDRIRESGLGAYNNTNIADIPSKTREELRMESWQSHIDRFSSLVNSYDGDYVLVSHALPIKAFLCSFLDLNEVESFGINIRNASMSILDVEEGKVMCLGSLMFSDRLKKFFKVGSRQNPQ